MAASEILPCPICSAGLIRVKPWLTRCPECDFWRSDLTPGGGRGVAGLEELRRDNFAILLRRLEPRVRGRRLLEIGSAEGWFLKAAAAAGFQVHGIEPCQESGQSDQLPGTVDHGFFPADLSNPGPYDVIVFNDVFEHFPDPVKILREVERVLVPGGHLVINLPVSSGVLYRIAVLMDRFGLHGPFDRLWQRGLPSPHISYFNRRNLTALMVRHTGLRLCDDFALPSMTRRGLWARIRSTSALPASVGMFAALWGLSFVIGLLPPDTVVMVYRRLL